MNITCKAERYIAQQILDKANSLSRDYDWQKKIENLTYSSEAFIKDKCKDFHLEKMFNMENSPIWQQVKKDEKRTENPILDFTKKISKGTKLFFEKTSYLREQEKLTLEKIRLIIRQIEKDIREYERKEKETVVENDFDYTVRMSLVENLEKSIKQSLMETKRINPKYFGTNEEYTNEYDFFLEENSELFSRIKRKTLFKEPMTPEEKNEAVRLITRTATQEYMDTLIPEKNITPEELIKIKDEIKASNEQYLLIRLERLGYELNPNGVMKFNGSLEELKKSIPYVKHMKTYGYNFNILETRFLNNEEDKQRFKEISNFLSKGSTTLKLEKVENKEMLFSQLKEIQFNEKGILARGDERQTHDTMTCDPDNLKTLLIDLKKLLEFSEKKFAVGYTENEEKPKIALTKKNFMLNEIYEPQKLVKKIDSVMKNYDLLNSSEEKRKIKIRSLFSEEAKWEFEITTNDSIKLVGEPKVCETIVSLILEKEEIKNILVNDQLVKGEMIEEFKQKEKKQEKTEVEEKQEEVLDENEKFSEENMENEIEKINEENKKSDEAFKSDNEDGNFWDYVMNEGISDFNFENETTIVSKENNNEKEENEEEKVKKSNKSERTI